MSFEIKYRAVVLSVWGSMPNNMLSGQQPFTSQSLVGCASRTRLTAALLAFTAGLRLPGSRATNSPLGVPLTPLRLGGNGFINTDIPLTESAGATRLCLREDEWGVSGRPRGSVKPLLYRLLRRSGSLAARGMGGLPLLKALKPCSQQFSLGLAVSAYREGAEGGLAGFGEGYLCFCNTITPSFCPHGRGSGRLGCGSNSFRRRIVGDGATSRHPRRNLGWGNLGCGQ